MMAGCWNQLFTPYPQALKIFVLTILPIYSNYPILIPQLIFIFTSTLISFTFASVPF